MKTESFEETLESAVTAGLQDELGDEAGIVSVFLDPTIAFTKPDAYVKSLGRMIPSTAKVDALVRAIVQRLYQDLGLDYRESEGWKLSDYVSDAVGRIESAGDFRKASNAFKRAATDYREAAKKIPGIAPVLNELASQMDAWCLVESARFHHQEEQYRLAGEDYARAQELFGNTRTMRYLGRHYEACSILEVAEEHSRQEQQEASAESFKKAVGIFREFKAAIENLLTPVSDQKAGKDLKRWVDLSRDRERYCLGRAELEEAKILDKKGLEDESSAKYRSASQRFQELMSEASSEQEQRELETLSLLCHAWAEMKEAEASASPELYAEASQLFANAERVTARKKFRLLSLASSSMCRALESGTRFRRTRDTQLYSVIKKDLETATDYYQSAGLTATADWTRATGKLFDALVYLTDAAIERQSIRKTELFQLAEKHLDAAAKLYGQAGFSLKKEQALQLLKRAREDMELFMGPIEALSQTPSLTGVAVPPVSLVREKTGLEEFSEANIACNCSLPEVELGVGSHFKIELEIANVGRTTATLIKLENLLTDGLELVREKGPYRIGDNFLDLGGRRLDFLKTLELKIPLKAARKGKYQLHPRVLYLDERGNYKSSEVETGLLTIVELGISGWLKGPK